MKRLLCLLFLLSILLVSCSEYSKPYNELNAGETLTPEAIDSIAAAVSAAETTSPEDALGQMYDENNAPIYFWVESGEVYHINSNCQSLRRSKNILSGSEADALAAGKERICGHCQKHLNIN